MMGMVDADAFQVWRDLWWLFYHKFSRECASQWQNFKIGNYLLKLR